MNVREQTQMHIERVRQFLAQVQSCLMARALNHDMSKLASPELEVFEKYTPKLAGSTYGSDEYKQFLKEMKPALDHHYVNNRHHPEFQEQGVDGMTLVDLVEMLADWINPCVTLL